MQDILSDEFWVQNFSDDETSSKACRKLQSLSYHQIKDLKAKYKNNPFLFLRCNNKIFGELKKIGIDIAVDPDDQNKICFINKVDWLKRYNDLANLSNGYYDDNGGGGYCQTYAAMKAFGYDPETINEDTAHQLRTEVAEYKMCDEFGVDSIEDIPKHELEKSSLYNGLYKNLITKNKWVQSINIIEYLSDKNKKPCWDISHGKKFNGHFICARFMEATFEDILYGCPFVILVNSNHTVNLTKDKTKRKKFVLDFFSFLSDMYIYEIFGDCVLPYHDDMALCNISIKNNFCNEFIPAVLSKLFKQIENNNVATQLENFFNDVPHKYKNMSAIKLMFYIFDKYKIKILESFDINMPEDKFPTANKFLSNVIDDLKKDLSMKYPDLGKIFNHGSIEKPEKSKTESEKPHESEKISDNPDPEPVQITVQTTKKPETNEQKNDQQIDSNKKNEIKTKEKPESGSKKKIFSGSKVLYVFLLIITFGIFYFFRSAPEVKKLPHKKDDKNKTQNKSSSEEIKTNEIDELSKLKSDYETKPLSNLSDLNSRNKNQFCNESKKINYNQHEH